MERERSLSAKWLAALALAALLGTSCSGATADVAPAPESNAVDDVPESLPLADEQPVTAEPSAASPAAPTDPAPSSSTTTLAPDPHRTWIATARDHVVALAAYDEPDGVPLALPFLVPNPHQFGGPLTVMVTEGQPGDEWVRVQLPVRPNGQEGWIRTADYDLSATRVRAEVDLSDRRVVVFDGDEIIAETSAVVGTDVTPTPLGTFYVAAKKRNGEDEYFLGPWALVLSSFSEVHETFGGGLPVIAVHGTHRPEQVGQSLSNGCIRVPNEVVEFLAENVPLGAPITIAV